MRDLPATTGTVDERLRSLALDTVELDGGWEDVLDPAGGQVDDFVACANELADLMRTVLAELHPAR